MLNNSYDMLNNSYDMLNISYDMLNNSYDMLFFAPIVMWLDRPKCGR